ncbi:MAG: carboxypeptidase-like regulatory domain-containing protein [Flavobacteriaceae bacterium]|nr:carboxypeptidase-like regulatory domain-containing protein [Flavobacteriaceae bacterium]
MPKFIFFLFFTSLCFSQTKTVTGVVSDTLNKPLESANVIAKPLQEKTSLKFAIADNKGRYRLELESAVSYEINISYIGYIEQSTVIEANDSRQTYDFRLVPTGETLKEIIIQHEFKPIIIKKDTLIYDVASFAKGNERKMKEVLEKLPGVEVDKDGSVTVQGKKVTKMLVEGKSFFGGGSKLAVENIPADALDKIEVIDHFNEVGFMKEVSGSDDLAMNVKLKEEKKKFVFGDIEAAAEAANDNGYYLAHTGLFYYSPKTNVSFIGDINNVGKSVLTFQDLMRFEGGVSSFLSGRKSLSNLYSFTNDNQDVIENKSQFAAVNFSHDTSPKLTISGFGLFAKSFLHSYRESLNEYLQNNAVSFENKTDDNKDKAVSGLGNIKLDYSPNKNEKWYYNSQFQFGNNDTENTILSIADGNEALFETNRTADNYSFKQYVEWHKSHNKNHTTTLVINNAFEQNKPQNQWFTNQSFLPGLIPLEEDDSYTIRQVKKIKNTSVDALFKHYWVINNFNHLYSVVGNNFGSSSLTTSEEQLLTNGGINDFSGNGFGNDARYRLNDLYAGLEYKFKWGNWTNKPGIYLHNYLLKTEQPDGLFSVNKTLLQPQWDSDYEFNKSETLKFRYRFTNAFPEIHLLANRFTLQHYNTVFKGNALLENEQYHSANLFYNKMNMYRGIILYGNISYSKKIKTTRNMIELDGTNRFSTPVLTDNPETNWNINGSFSKKIYRFTARLHSRLSWFNYIQTLNDITTTNDRNSQNIGISVKTSYKKWPDVSFGYTKGFNRFKGLTDSHFQTDSFTANLGFDFLRDFTFKFDYENFRNSSENQSNYFDIATVSLRYQKKNSPLGFELSAYNLFDNKTKNNYSFSDFMVSQQTTFILPRIVMLSLSYKL